MKKCSKCGIEKELEEFNLVHPAKQDGKKRPDCKACVRARTSVYYYNDPAAAKERMKIVTKRARKVSKSFVAEYLKSHPCVDCGEADTIVLDFDHVRGKKVCDVSRLANLGSRLWKLILEIEKCEVRCANCHRRITHKRREADVQQLACLPSKQDVRMQLPRLAPVSKRC